MSNKQSAKKYMDVRRPNNLKANKVSKSQTLMRKSVKKPKAAPTKKVVSKIKSEDIKSIRKIRELNAVSKNNLMKEKRIKSIPKSKLISKFNQNLNVKNIKLPSNTTVGIEIAKLKEFKKEDIVSPAKKLIDKSLEMANAHELKKLPKKRTSLIVFVSIILGFILILLAIVSYNHFYPKVKLSLSSTSAGFDATSPSFIPAGYHLSNVQTSNAKVVSSYKTSTDNRNFSITEVPSNWDNSTLEITYLQPNGGSNFTNLSQNGIKVYFYGTNQATWVTGQIWYRLDSNTNLPNKDIMSIATSM